MRYRGLNGYFLYADKAFAGSLLFAMGLQNALVSVISGSVVRTTHLTGTFTDLGIDLAQIKFSSFAAQKNLFSRIRLRLAIVFCFMMGALLGAYLFGRWNFRSFLIAIFFLVFALFYDIFRLNFKRYYTSIARLVKNRN